MALNVLHEAAIASVSRQCFSWGMDAERIGGGQIRVTVYADGEQVAQWQQVEPNLGDAPLSSWLAMQEDEFIARVRISGANRPPRLQRRNRRV